ncbi:unnamed protein product, partial [Symbiodinium sp. KB8]
MAPHLTKLLQLVKRAETSAAELQALPQACTELAEKLLTDGAAKAASAWERPSSTHLDQEAAEGGTVPVRSQSLPRSRSGSVPRPKGRRSLPPMPSGAVVVETSPRKAVPPNIREAYGAHIKLLMHQLAEQEAEIFLLRNSMAEMGTESETGASVADSIPRSCLGPGHSFSPPFRQGTAGEGDDDEVDVLTHSPAHSDSWQAEAPAVQVPEGGTWLDRGVYVLPDGQQWRRLSSPRAPEAVVGDIPVERVPSVERLSVVWHGGSLVDVISPPDSPLRPAAGQAAQAEGTSVSSQSTGPSKASHSTAEGEHTMPEAAESASEHSANVGQGSMAGEHQGTLGDGQEHSASGTESGDGWSDSGDFDDHLSSSTASGQAPDRDDELEPSLPGDRAVTSDGEAEPPAREEPGAPEDSSAAAQGAEQGDAAVDDTPVYPPEGLWITALYFVDGLGVHYHRGDAASPWTEVPDEDRVRLVFANGQLVSTLPPKGPPSPKHGSTGAPEVAPPPPPTPPPPPRPSSPASATSQVDAATRTETSDDADQPPHVAAESAGQKPRPGAELEDSASSSPVDRGDGQASEHFSEGGVSAAPSESGGGAASPSTSGGASDADALPVEAPDLGVQLEGSVVGFVPSDPDGSAGADAADDAQGGMKPSTLERAAAALTEEDMKAIVPAQGLWLDQDYYMDGMLQHWHRETGQAEWSGVPADSQRWDEVREMLAALRAEQAAAEAATPLPHTSGSPRPGTAGGDDAEAPEESDAPNIPPSGMYLSQAYFIDGTGVHWGCEPGTGEWSEVPQSKRFQLVWRGGQLVDTLSPPESEAGSVAGDETASAEGHKAGSDAGGEGGSRGGGTPPPAMESGGVPVSPVLPIGPPEEADEEGEQEGEGGAAAGGAADEEEEDSPPPAMPAFFNPSAMDTAGGDQDTAPFDVSGLAQLQTGQAPSPAQPPQSSRFWEQAAAAVQSQSAPASPAKDDAEKSRNTSANTSTSTSMLSFLPSWMGGSSGAGASGAADDGDDIPDWLKEERAEGELDPDRPPPVIPGLPSGDAGVTAGVSLDASAPLDVTGPPSMPNMFSMTGGKGKGKARMTRYANTFTGAGMLPPVGATP